jgi:Tfp pilus assembly protein PilX
MRWMRHRTSGDEGFALVTAVLAGSVVMALAIAAAAVAVDGFKSARVDSATGRSLGAAEAGVTRAIQYFRDPQGGPRTLTCVPATPSTCSSTVGYNSITAPKPLTFSDGSTAKVWIEVVKAFSPPQYLTGTYVVHSEGTSANGVAVRKIEETVSVSPVSFPLGIFTNSDANFQGNGQVHRESLFANGCVTQRGGNDHLLFPSNEVDSYYGIPPAVHATGFIVPKEFSDSQVACSATPPVNVMHKNTPACYDMTWTTSPLGASWYDQSRYGGTWASGSACSTQAGTRFDTNPYFTKSSYFDKNILTNVFGFRPTGLTNEVYNYLKAVAKDNGTYFTTNAVPAMPSGTGPSAVKHPVLFWDLPASAGNPTVTISNQLDSYAWVPDDATDSSVCTSDHPTVVIIVRQGKLNFSGKVAGAIFVPEGNLQFDSNADLVGTLFSNTFVSNAQGVANLNDCYAKSTNPVLLDPRSVHFRQVDQAS